MNKGHSRKKRKSIVFPIIMTSIIILFALLHVFRNNFPLINSLLSVNKNILINETSETTISDNLENSQNSVSNILNLNSVKLLSDYDENTLIDEMDIVKFGSYPQSDETGIKNDEIEWIVLERDEKRALLLSKYILDCKCYNNENIDVTWETCDLRKWLNDDFYNKAFNNDEKSLIVTTNIINSDNAEYGTLGGNSTYDNVFCLSIDEIIKYFGSGEKIDQGYQLGKNVTTKGTKYAKKVNNNGSKLFVRDENDWYRGNSSYWLRSSGYFQNCSSCVSESGFLDISNIFQGVGYSDYGVRPALYIINQDK